MFSDVGRSLRGAVVTVYVDKPCGAQCDDLLLWATLAAKAASYPEGIIINKVMLLCRARQNGGAGLC